MKKLLTSELVIVCVSVSCILFMINVENETSTLPTQEQVMVDAVIMKSDGKELGVVPDCQVGEEAIEQVKDIYAESANIENVREISINNDIEFENTTCYKEDVLNKNEVANKIIHYNDNNDENIVSFTIVKENVYNEVPYTLISNTDNSEITFAENTQEVDLYKEVFLDSSIYTPLKGVLTSTFGEQRGGYMHKGIDLAANMGTEIGAALEGVVTFSGVMNGYGNVVILNHNNGIETVYAHCSKLNVNSGDSVYKGQVISEVGNTGDSTGPHLHFEIRVNGAAVDPLKYNYGIQY